MDGRSSNASLRAHHAVPTDPVASRHSTRVVQAICLHSRSTQALIASTTICAPRRVSRISHPEDSRKTVQEWRHNMRVIAVGALLAVLCTLLSIVAASSAFAQEECLPDDITVNDNCPGSNPKTSAFESLARFFSVGVVQRAV